tara:strand:+ start:1728 stop:2663 length:936 start_codon:yes stop_codon:yes gene_type:complete
MLNNKEDKCLGNSNIVKPQLCLGSAQFGLSYGITNNEGQVREEVVCHLLKKAKESGFTWLDTAQAYGNAESVLGRQLDKNHGYNLISKVAKQAKGNFNKKDAEKWEKGFFDSCKRLRVEKLHSLLLHSPGDLRKPGSEYLKDWLISLRDRGLVERIGISIYSSEDLEGINPDLTDMVQLPLSLYDQRLLEDQTISRLRSMGIKIHARSVYMQGLLLTQPVRWPSWVSVEVRNHHRALNSLAEEKGCNLIDLALGFIQEQVDVEAVTLGLCTEDELSSQKETWERYSPWEKDEWRHWALQDTSILDPRLWPE